MKHRLTIKGQVTVPKAVRDFLGLTAGASAVEFVIDDEGRVVVRRAGDTSRTGSSALGRGASGDKVDPCAFRGCDRVLALLNGQYC